jgi:hypothetical protein
MRSHSSRLAHAESWKPWLEVSGRSSATWRTAPASLPHACIHAYLNLMRNSRSSWDICSRVLGLSFFGILDLRTRMCSGKQTNDEQTNKQTNQTNRQTNKTNRRTRQNKQTNKQNKQTNTRTPTSVVGRLVASGASSSRGCWALYPSWTPLTRDEVQSPTAAKTDVIVDPLKVRRDHCRLSAQPTRIHNYRHGEHQPSFAPVLRWISLTPCRNT